ncbi:Mu transposase C-terminal domain-containing protein [Pseudarthrobacter sp. NIBRBAC000502772]|uniref:Mu transposase C-terminal domain-containing protein n=1 Tax=Pseudarthrobacter sp. NIBRBAC000502772 TaxID=2590775 RepID=UPI001FF06266|nr:Mu transposase C-terminal domain-containing protein [Pseudarthrobacter sp. NIBRBAC000502772]
MLFQGQRFLAPTLGPFVGHTVTIRCARDIFEIHVYNHDTFICIAIDEARPNLRLSLRDSEPARRARPRELRRTVNERIPVLVTRDHYHPVKQPCACCRIKCVLEFDRALLCKVHF